MTDRPRLVPLWWRALRAYSFPASIVPAVVGAAIAVSAGVPVTWLYAPLVLLAGVALHVSTNLINDAADFERGVDSVTAQGGSGVLVAGWLSARQVWAAAALAVLVAALAGLPVLLARGWPLWLIGAAGALGGYAYTGPPFGLKYRAVGELWVFLLMGVLMVAGAAYALTGVFPPTVWAASLPVAFLVAAILAANNQRDRADDQRHRIATLAILLGDRGAALITSVLIAAPYVAVVALVAARVLPWPALAPLATSPLAVPLAAGAWRAGTGQALPPAIVERTAALHLVFGLTYAAGLFASALLD